MLSVSLEEYVDSKMKLFCSRYNIPERLQEDIRQEIALAVFANLDKPNRGWIAERAVVRFLKKEKEFSERNVSLESGEYKEVLEQTEVIEEAVQTVGGYVRRTLIEVSKKLDEEEQRRAGWKISPDRYCKFTRFAHMMRFILNKNADVSEKGYVSGYANEVGVTRETGRMCFTKLSVVIRNSEFGNELLDYNDVLCCLRNIESALM